VIGRVKSTTHLVEVGDLQDAQRWYADVLGRGPDIEPVDGVLEWELREGTWLQVAEGAPNPQPGQMLRLGVEDIDAATAALAEAGVDVGEVERVEGVIAFCEFQDPFGNPLSLYQEL
jgi:catechol 2,3-dioxygenase-like lactoylglutathione lyase family enzyme